MQVKTVLRCHTHSVGEGCIKQTNKKKTTKKITDIDVHLEKQKHLSVVGGNSKLCSHFGKQCGSFLKSETLTVTKKVSILAIYPREIKTCVHTKTFMWIFTVTFLIMAPNWK